MTGLRADSRVIRGDGWGWAGDLKPGDDLLCLHGDGQLDLTRIADVRHTTADEALVLVLTEVGEVSLLPSEPLLTTGGPVLARDLIEMTAHTTVKVEVVQPAAIASTSKFKLASGRAAALLAMQWLGRTSTALPASVAEQRGQELESILTSSKLAVTRSGDSRWTSWSWPSIDSTASGNRPPPQSLLALTAWTADVSRTVLHDRVARSALLMSIVLDGRQPKVTWTPGYSPVECRVAVNAAALPIAKAISARPERGRVTKLRLVRPGAVICSQMAVGRLS